MKSFNKWIASSAAAIVVTMASVLSFNAVVSAACTHQYNPQGSSTSKTPIFNNFCNVPGQGDESDFVRIRTNTTGDPATGSNADYVDSLNSACNVGTKYDVRTYVHNGADPSGNGNGSGQAVAHNVHVAMSAPLNSNGSKFTFGGSITASNAAGVSDTATLNCSGEAVKLKLVPNSVKIYSKPYGWNALGDGAVNGSTKVGSPTMGSGDVWACWDWRIVVVYQVTIEKVEKPPVVAKCELLKILAHSDRRVTVSQFKYTNENAAVKNVVLNWGDGSAAYNTSNANSIVGQEHKYNADGTYTITAVVTFSAAGQQDIVSGGAGTACVQKVKFKPNQPPEVVPPPEVEVPPTVPPKVGQPTTLVNTGAGSVAALFGTVTAAGAIAHRWLTSRRLED